MKTAIQKAKSEILELWSSPSNQPTYSQIFDILDKAELLEKQQIINANNAGWRANRRGLDQNAEDYYNEIFK